jgi:hypothetical protein
MNHKKSKFYQKKKFSWKEFGESLLFWRSRRKGIIQTRDITLDDIRSVFFPKNFYEKYRYLGSIPWREGGDYFKAIYPLVLAMDYEARPRWCPRWFLRFLHLFGSDNSIVRVRNRFWHDLKSKLTRDLTLYDYKTKWSDWDLRISVVGPRHIVDLSRAIENQFYIRGKTEFLLEEIKRMDPDRNETNHTLSHLEKRYQELLEKYENEEN